MNKGERGGRKIGRTGGNTVKGRTEEGSLR